ncbi:MAG TPA: DUF222 domain-containing protein [Actinoplanes sp.]|nr:DUF222 domain-containing protein [Actinoplanes sp.]
MDERLAVLARALMECRSVPVWALPDSALVDGVDLLQAVVQQATALQLEFIREIDGRGIAVGQGATSTAAWLRERHRISAGTAIRQVKLAAALDADCPATADALAEGAVNTEQAHVIAAAVADLPAQHRPAGEKHLIGEAGNFGPRELTILGRRLLEVVAPDEAEARAQAALGRAEERAHTGRDLRLSEIPGEDRVRLTGWLDREGAATVHAALDPLCAPHASTDGADTRTPGQRRADALVEICRLATACGDLPANGGDRPQVVVTVNLNTLRTQIGAATLDDGSPLSAAAARRLACDAAILPAVLGSTGQVLDVGRERRLFTGPLRRALILRDRGCAFPGCGRPPAGARATTSPTGQTAARPPWPTPSYSAAFTTG